MIGKVEMGEKQLKQMLPTVMMMTAEKRKVEKDLVIT